MAPKNVTPFHTPSEREIEEAEVTKFMRNVNKKHGLKLGNYWDLHKWSVTSSNDFYNAVVDHYNVIIEKGAQPLFDAAQPITDTAKLIPRAKMNYAENALCGHKSARSTVKFAVIGAIEELKGQSPITGALTFAQLYDEVNYMSNTLKKLGIQPGDRVCAFSANNIDAIIGVLAAASLGAVWSSCAVEMGTQGCLERFSQIQPKVMFTVSSYRNNGKTFQVMDKVAEVAQALAPLGLQHVFVTQQLAELPVPAFPSTSGVKYWKTTDARSFGAKDAPAQIPFWRGPANHPLWVLYSSGTTGKPKALIHNVFGMVMHAKISNTIHQSLGEADLQVQNTTLGWMMWNNSLGLLCCGAGVVAFDGSPLSPLGKLWDIVERTSATSIGLSPRYLALLQQNNFYPNRHYNLRSLKVVLTAGSPLKPELYQFIFDGIRNGIFINNGSGGTDVCGCLVAGVQTLPVHAGEICAPVLGVAIEAWDDKGRSVVDQEANMVFTKPIPNSPLGLWGDEGNKRYLSTYFETFRNAVVWDQADWITINGKTGGVTIHGRSDGTLNANGVRIGTAEIYQTVDPLFESICVPQKVDGDERIVLFIKTPNGRAPTKDDVQAIRSRIVAQLSTRHIPKVIIGVTDIPYNASAKKLEVAVRKLINGTPRKDVNTVMCVNPACLDEYRPDRPELRNDAKAKL